MLGFAAPRAADTAIAAVDNRYVHADSFGVFQKGLELRAQRDSIEQHNDMREIRAVLARLDSGVASVRKCQRHPDACE